MWVPPVLMHGKETRTCDQFRRANKDGALSLFSPPPHLLFPGAVNNHNEWPFGQNSLHHLWRSNSMVAPALGNRRKWAYCSNSLYRRRPAVSLHASRWNCMWGKEVRGEGGFLTAGGPRDRRSWEDSQKISGGSQEPSRQSFH